MITHPLDLASRLRPPPRSFDWVFYVNFVLIAAFFVLFGSRFVLSPALAVDGENLNMPLMAEGSVSLLPSTLVVSVKANSQIFVDPNGLVNDLQLKQWFAERAKRTPGASVLIRADKGVRFEVLAAIVAAAKTEGLFPLLAGEPMRTGGAGE